MKQVVKKIMVFVFAIILISSFMPVSVMAEGLEPVSYIDVDGSEKTVDEYTVVQSTTTTLSGWYVVNADVTITSRISCSGNVKLILCDGATLTATKGITCDFSNALTIYAQKEGTGSIIATAPSGYAGIGGAVNNGSNITINGGVITATGGNDGAGIGGGYYSPGSNITINGGKVTATGGLNAAGIGGGGGGYNAAGSNITINNGVVTAIGGTDGAGIGGGKNYSGINISINGGVVLAESGANTSCIGGGFGGVGTNIKVSADLILKIGNDSASAVETIHTGTQDVGTNLANKLYASTEKSTQTISFEETAVEKLVGDDKFTNELTGAKSAVSYESSDTSVATVDDDGEVTVVGAGTTTIKATAVESGTFKKAEKEYTLVVQSPVYAVTFENCDHGTAPDPQMVRDGEFVAEPTAPSAEGYVFVGWFKDVTFNTNSKWDFGKDTVSEDITLYAKWVKKETKVSAGDTGVTVDEDALQKILDNYKGIATEIQVKINIVKDDVDETEKALIKAENEGKKFEFYDVDLIFVEQNDELDYGDTNNQLIAITYKFDFTGKENFQVFRAHKGAVTELTETANEDDEKVTYDKEAGTITVVAKKYSTYAFAYDEIPETGDYSNAWLYLTLAILSMAAIGVGFSFKKK